VLVAYARKPSYSGGRDQEDCGSKTVRANSLGDWTSKKPITKRAGGVVEGINPEFKPQCHQKTLVLQKKKKSQLITNVNYINSISSLRLVFDEYLCFRTT
jgi:hypothetical protein